MPTPLQMQWEAEPQGEHRRPGPHQAFSVTVRCNHGCQPYHPPTHPPEHVVHDQAQAQALALHTRRRVQGGWGVPRRPRGARAFRHAATCAAAPLCSLRPRQHARAPPERLPPTHLLARHPPVEAPHHSVRKVAQAAALLGQPSAARRRRRRGVRGRQHGAGADGRGRIGAQHQPLLLGDVTARAAGLVAGGGGVGRGGRGVGQGGAQHLLAPGVHLRVGTACMAARVGSSRRRWQGSCFTRRSRTRMAAPAAPAAGPRPTSNRTSMRGSWKMNEDMPATTPSCAYLEGGHG